MAILRRNSSLFGYAGRIPMLALLVSAALATAPGQLAAQQGNKNSSTDAPSTGPSGTPQEQTVSLVGQWSLNWQGAFDTYSGTLAITKQVNENLYTGVVTILPSKGGNTVQDVRVVANGNNLNIECSNPRVNGKPSKTYSPDRFFVVLAGSRMEGFSLDAAGNRGRKIVLDKAR